MNRAAYTPSELNREVRLHLEAGFPRLWVEGEISNLSRPASGHLYFTLKDDKAQIRCALFKGNTGGLGFRPANGQLVQARGRLSLYEPRGDYQLICDALEDAGEGRLRAAFEALKKRLAEEGLFAEDAKQPLPTGPTRIAVITSPSGAVIRDILHVLARRWPLAMVRLYPVPVQGVEAAPAIVRALAAANRHGWAQAIILGRGGGSLEDLWPFNEEVVARAVFASGIPVVSAVGHETDFSICDFVADLRAPTPSAAAELLTPDRAVLQRSFATTLRRMTGAMGSQLARRSQQHDQLAQRLYRQHPQRRLAEQARLLQGLAARLRAATSRGIPDRQRSVTELRGRLKRFGDQLVPDRRRALNALARTLHAVSPLPTLERGYAVVSDAATGHAISSTGALSAGQLLRTRLKDGSFTARVEQVTTGIPEDDTK